MTFTLLTLMSKPSVTQLYHSWNFFNCESITEVSFKTSFHPKFMCKKHFFNSKNKQDLLRGYGVYKLEYPECSAAYIGKTRQDFITRYEEHLRSSNLNGTKFYMHLLENYHKIKGTPKSTVLHLYRKEVKLDLLEALEINTLKKI